MTVRFGSKVPGTSMEIRDVTMDFAYGESFTESSPRRTNGSSWMCCSATPTSSPVTRRSRSPGRSSTRSRGTGTRTDARAVRLGQLGPRGSRRDARTRRTELAQAMKIDLTDTTASNINKALVKARRAIGSPAVGMVLTMVIVTDEENAYDALKAAERRLARAPLAHPGRHQAAARAPRDRTHVPARRRGARGRGRRHRRDGAAPAVRRAWPTTPTRVVLPLLLPDAPVVVWWPADAPDVPARTRWARSPSAGSPTRTRSSEPLERLEARAGAYAPGDTDLAWTRLTPGAPCSPRPSTRPGRRSSRRSSRARPTTPAPSCWPAGSAPACACRSTACHRRAGRHRGPARHRGRRHRHRPPRGPAGHADHARASPPAPSR